jgi:hypothetical protein
MGQMVDGEGTKAGFRTVRSTETQLGFNLVESHDGEKLTVRYGEFRSAEEANRYFEWNAAKSFKILTRGTKYGSKGKSVGLRAEVLLEQGKAQSAVMWTNGTMFRVIIAKSLASAVELEKKYGE